MGRLDGKVAIITGGGTGMGAAAAKLFAKEGAKVVITGRRLEKLQNVVDAAKAEGYDIVPMQQDVSKEEDWKRVTEGTEKLFGKINVLYSNAGVLDSVPYNEITYENWTKVMNINGWGQILAYKYIVPCMRRAGGGAIVVTSSMCAVNSGGGLTAYCASKGASDAMSRAASILLAEYNIRVNTILPGTIATPMLADAFQNADDYKAMESTQLMGRAGTPEEIAYLALYLASDESGYTNGVSIMVDGGLHNSAGTKPNDM